MVCLIVLEKAIQNHGFRFLNLEHNLKNAKTPFFSFFFFNFDHHSFVSTLKFSKFRENEYNVNVNNQKNLQVKLLIPLSQNSDNVKKTLFFDSL